MSRSALARRISPDGVPSSCSLRGQLRGQLPNRLCRKWHRDIDGDRCLGRRCHLAGLQELRPEVLSAPGALGGRVGDGLVGLVALLASLGLDRSVHGVTVEQQRPRDAPKRLSHLIHRVSARCECFARVEDAHRDTAAVWGRNADLDGTVPLRLESDLVELAPHERKHPMQIECEVEVEVTLDHDHLHGVVRNRGRVRNRTCKGSGALGLANLAHQDTSGLVTFCLGTTTGELNLAVGEDRCTTAAPAGKLQLNRGLVLERAPTRALCRHQSNGSRVVDDIAAWNVLGENTKIH
mmetsp:Transcript_54577/g.128927  ORF Transcript_54577/g.128927 Transcript_54577/m.128927 type:complete len:294 (+) Transcript_54577:421-1302(+)